MTTRTSWFLIAGAALAAALAGFWLARGLNGPAPQLAGGTWLPQARPVGDIHLSDDTGHAFTREQLAGRPSLVYFGFTHCPDVCPTTLAKLARVEKNADVPGLRVLFVTVDPERDTPSAMHQYVQSFGPDFVGLTGNAQSVSALTTQFGVAASRVDLPGGDYTMDHSAAVFLLDRQARIAAIFTPPFDISRLAQDLRAAAPYLKSAT